MQIQTKLCHCFTKINIRFFSGSPKLPLVLKLSPSPEITKSCLRLSV